MKQSESLELMRHHGIRPTANRDIVVRTLADAVRPLTLSELEQEIVNTAIENAANMLSPEQNPLAKKAKDLAGAGVLFVCIGNTIAWGAAIYVVVRHLLAS